MSDSETEVTIRAEGLAIGGAFIGPITEGPAHLIGKKAFVRGAAPGELVRARIERDKKGYIDARLIDVAAPSPSRAAPPCPIFGVCGGCDLQHLSLPAQRETKRRMVETILLRQGGLAPRRGVRLAGEGLPDLHYRNRITLHVERDGTIGFYRLATNRVVSVRHCYISDRKINEAIEILQRNKEIFRPLLTAIALETAHDDLFVTFRLHAKAKRPDENLLQTWAALFPHIRVEQEGEKIFESMESGRPVGHFAQVNESANAVLQRLVAELVRNERVTDMFAGAGNLSMSLARAGRDVDLVEIDKKLVEEAKRKARGSGLGRRFSYFTKSCEEFVKTGTLQRTVVLDPPRSGAREIVPFISAHTTDQVVYVSCFPPTLCRDLRQLVSQGYMLESVFVLDMFPQTYHVETICDLRLGGSPS